MPRSWATGAAVDVEQSVLLDPRTDVAGPASVVVLGYGVEVFPDEDAFSAAPASLVDPTAEDRERPPNLPPAMSWPLRVASVSFMSDGLFADPASATADARLSGEVLAAETRRNTLTGLPFHVARVRTVGFEVDLCLPGGDHPAPPPVGAIVSGWVYLVADLSDDLVRARARRGPRLPFRR